jgi:LysM repeat protein
MSYWGWRRIFAFFVSVLVVGCSATYESAPTLPPTSLPPVTLIARGLISATPPVSTSVDPIPPQAAPTALLYTVQAGDTLLGIARQFGVTLSELQVANSSLNPLTLPIGLPIIIPNPPFNAQGDSRLPTPTPVALVVLVPVCHPTTTDGIVCLGRVLNTLNAGVEQVNVSLQLLRQDGSRLAEGSAGIEQAFIPAGGSAPYRALFKAEWRDYAAAAAWLESAEIEGDTGQPHIVVEIQNQQVHLMDGQYVVSATLHNPAAQNAHLLQAVLTVEDASGQIIAYRVLPLDDELPAGGDLSFQISVMVDAPITHTLYIEAEGE